MGIAGRSFARSMENLHEAAQIRMSEEMLRNVVESEGKAVLKASAEEQLEIDRLVGVTRKDHRGLGKLLGREAARVRLRAATERVGLVDGAVCLRNHLEVLPLERVLLDFFHLSEHVNDASRKTLGEKTEAGEKWVHEVLHT